MKYNVDGNIDFFAELYKSLDTQNDTIESDEGKCLITQEPLTDKYVKMDCGHTFNYLPLFADLLNHKYLYNPCEHNESKLAPNEIRCPYCRKKQTTLLPYYEELGLEKIKGVNYPAHTNCLNRCFFKSPNKNFNPNLTEYYWNQKEMECGCVPTHVIDNKLYCYKHHFKIMKNKMKDAMQKKKEEAKQLVAAKKQAALEAKLKLKEEKLKLKEEKEKEKKEKQQEKKQKKEKKEVPFNTDNIIITPETQTQTQTCIAILKYGQRKGQCCGQKVYNEQLCKRHTKTGENNEV